MSRFAVLGASSFSGAAFVAHLLAQGDEVLLLQRPEHDVNTGLERIMAAVERRRPEYFVNFAALNVVAESWDHAADYFQTNVVGLARLHDRLRRWGGLAKYVQVSTPEVYGRTETFLQEGAPYCPSTPYAASRAAADMYLAMLHSAYGFPVAFTRTVNVYGPGQQLYRVIPKTVLSILRGQKLKLHGGGRSTRSFIHIRDVAEATRRVALDGGPGQVYHIATARQVAIRALVAMICERMGVRLEDATEPAPERLGKDMAYQLDDAKIRAELGWRDRIGLEEGLEETIDWFRVRAGSLGAAALEYEHRP